MAIYKTKPSVKLLCAAMIGAMGVSMLSGCETIRERAQAIDEQSEVNAGPCPRAFALYDAARFIQFTDGEERYASIGYTGEFGDMKSLCRYVGDNPISAGLDLKMDVGRGPAAQGNSFTYRYFVAVTRKNIEVIGKEYFTVTVTFPPGVDRMTVSESIDSIIIPRADETTSGENFEIVVGYDLTPQQVQFNRDGKRFRVNAGQGGQ